MTSSRWRTNKKQIIGDIVNINQKILLLLLEIQLLEEICFQLNYYYILLELGFRHTGTIELDLMGNNGIARRRPIRLFFSWQKFCMMQIIFLAH